MNARDTAAYKLLMDRVREEPHQALRSRARREIVYSQLFDDPDRYRGLPLHVEGIARRVLVQDVEGSVVFPDGRYYEVYAFTPSSQNNPYILAADEIPSELPIGDAVEVPVRFDGYFLKLMAYLAGDDKFRAAPLVVGRFQSVSSSDPLPVPASRNLRWLRYLGLALVVLLIVQGYRILRSLFGRERASELTGHSAVIDTIEPDELEAWVEREQRGLDPNEPEIADYDHPDSPENGRD